MFFLSRYTLVKTIVMTIGEIDYDDLPQKNDHRWVFQLFLVALIFFITVTYMNFMNGLAVADIRSMKEDADICRSVQIVDLIFYYELMHLGDPNEFWGKWTPFKVLKSLFKQSTWNKIHHLTRAHKILLLGKGSHVWTFIHGVSSYKEKNLYHIKELSKDMLNSIERVKIKSFH